MGHSRVLVLSRKIKSWFPYCQTKNAYIDYRRKWKSAGRASTSKYPLINNAVAGPLAAEVIDWDTHQMTDMQRWSGSCCNDGGWHIHTVHVHCVPKIWQPTPGNNFVKSVALLGLGWCQPERQLMGVTLFFLKKNWWPFSSSPLGKVMACFSRRLLTTPIFLRPYPAFFLNSVTK